MGDDVVDVSGLVVAPGFVDLHSHGQTNAANEYQAHDGVTTALELEGGVWFMDAWLASRTGNALINFGATVSHRNARRMAMEKYADEAKRARAIVTEEGAQLRRGHPTRARERYIRRPRWQDRRRSLSWSSDRREVPKLMLMAVRRILPLSLVVPA